ncbi:MAG: PHP domain-containing protein, partial [bacterium]
MSFVHLHSHTEYGSLLDSLVNVEDMVQKAVDMNMPAISINDHGKASSFVSLYKKCRDANIKPIFGCELYTVNNMYEKDKDETRYHLNVMAKNKKGLKNLFKLVTKAHKDGYYYKPRIDFNILQQYKKGLIVSTACIQSRLAQYALNNKKEQAVEWANKYKNVFSDDFYLEIMGNNMEDQYLVNERLVKLGDYLDIPVIATNDIHYL